MTFKIVKCCVTGKTFNKNTFNIHFSEV